MRGTIYGAFKYPPPVYLYMVVTMEYAKVSIPRDMVERARRVLARHGYRSVSEFVIDSVRRRLEELERAREVVE